MNILSTKVAVGGWLAPPPHPADQPSYYCSCLLFVYIICITNLFLLYLLLSVFFFFLFFLFFFLLSLSAPGSRTTRSPRSRTGASRSWPRTWPRPCALAGEVGFQGWGFEHRSTRGLEHVRNLRAKRNQTSCYLQPSFLGTPLVPSRRAAGGAGAAGTGEADRRGGQGTG